MYTDLVITVYSVLIARAACSLHTNHTFSALVSLAEQRSHLSFSSSFLATHSSYLACRAVMPSSTSLSLALASFRILSVSSRDSLASFKAAYSGGTKCKNMISEMVCDSEPTHTCTVYKHLPKLRVSKVQLILKTLLKGEILFLLLTTTTRAITACV